MGRCALARTPCGSRKRTWGGTIRRNNQNVVGVPHARFIEMLAYKAELVGLQVVETEESYTSKASFLDADALPV